MVLKRILPGVVIVLAGLGMAVAAESGKPTDYAGRPVVTQPAPVLNFQVKTAPLPGGIDYAFPEQTAHGVAWFARFPAFTLSDRRVHVDGPWYNDDAANGHFTHGITAVGAMPNFRQGPTDLSRRDPGQKWMLMTDPLWWEVAKRYAAELEKQNPGDPKLPALRLLAREHRLSNDEAAYRALGRRMWEGEKHSLDAQGRGWGYAMIDIECTEGWEHQRNCFGWLYQGLLAGAAADRRRLVPVTYGQWTFNVGAVYESMRQNGTGVPEYLKPEKNCLRANDPTLTACNDAAGVVSMDGYMQGIWGDEPFYQRDAQGRLLLKDGQPQFSERTATTAYGVSLQLESGEAHKCLEDLYRAGIRLYLMYHYAVDGYPAASATPRLPHLQNIRIGAWSRYTNEGLQGITQNDRPLPGWEIEMLIGMYLMLADDVVVWSSDFNNPPGRPGADYSKTWKYNTQGVVEFVIKALHRYSALDPIHHGPFQWCWFSLPMVNKNETDGDRYDQKPLAFGKLRTYQDRPWLELYVAWPGLDGQPAEFTVHLEKDGKRSPDYRFRLKNGRSYFYDAWQLPAAFAGCEGKDVVLEFKDPQGQARSWCGDWRANVDFAAK